MVQAFASHRSSYAPNRWDHLQCDDGVDVRSGSMHAPKSIWAMAIIRVLREGGISSPVGGMFVSGIYVDGQQGRINPAISVIRGCSSCLIGMFSTESRPTQKQPHHTH